MSKFVVEALAVMGIFWARPRWNGRATPTEQEPESHGADTDRSSARNTDDPARIFSGREREYPFPKALNKRILDLRG